jgi:DNA helicase-2/ATP-dependent DNA helicase PcrA
VEEALRRYNISYTMVGGFSFYERAEIKDLLAYLRLVRNPHDSMALQRVVNTPARGIGKTTLEAVERLALETGISTWNATAAAIANRLIPTRASMALDSFRQLILDAQAMMDPDFAGKLTADVAEVQAGDADTGFSFGAQGGDPETPEIEDVEAHFGGDENQIPLLDASHFMPSTHAPQKPFLVIPAQNGSPGAESNQDLVARSAFRTPGDSATLPELIRFIIDRTGYIKALETEGTPEAFSRIENLKELANAAHDAEERGETLAEFLDHAALASDTDQFDPNARVTLMTLHAAKGLEFSLVFLAGLEEGLFPHSRTLNNPEELEEERRLCYVGMTRAMNTLILTRAVYRRRYGNDMPEQSIPSRFLEEVPSELVENLGGRSPAWSTSAYAPAHEGGRGRWRGDDSGRAHFNYEDESQEIPRNLATSSLHRESTPKDKSVRTPPQGKSAGAPPPEHSIDNIARFFGGKSGNARPGSLARPAMEIPTAHGVTGLKKGQRVMHAKYGEGTVLVREGEGEDAKLTVLFQRHGMKKLMEKFANLKKI